MRVVVDARLARGSGHRTYLTNLVPRIARLAADWRFVLLGDVARFRVESWTQHANVELVECGAPLYGAREQLVLPLLTHGADLIWTPHYNIPMLASGRIVATIHDLAHRRLPEYTGSVAKQIYARTLLSAVRRKCAALIFVSEFSRREFVELVGPPRCPTVVTPEGVDAAWFDRSDDASPEDAPYFLFVGNLKPHKNVTRLIEAFARVRGQLGHRLLIIGRSDGYVTGERPLDTMAGFGSDVRHLERVDDQSLRRYVRHAAALVFPSTYEGFGLPPLEAMASGTPVIAARAASIPEVCGDAALYFDPFSSAELSEHLLRVARDSALRADLRTKGLARAGMFRWDDTAAATLEALRAALR